MKISAFLAASLDGYIADAQGGIAWLEQANTLAPAGEDCGFGAFFATIDGLVIGRKTFAQVASFPNWPYSDKPLYVLSHSLTRLPAGTPATVSILKGDPRTITQQLAQAGHQHLYVDGGLVVQAFLAAQLLNEITITHIPVVLGAGIALFGALPTPVWLTLRRSQAYPFGFVQSTYQVSTAAP